MKVKNMSKEQAIETIELLKSRIDFNNRLNKFVRKYRKDNNITKDNFNGWHDAPTEDMCKKLFELLSKETWMTKSDTIKYMRDAGAIFGQTYSVAVNSYILKDLHDVEKYLATLEDVEDKTEEDNKYFKIERDLDNTRLNLFFDDIPSEQVRGLLKHNGFKWSPYLQAWTRQLTTNAEQSLTKLILGIDKLSPEML